MVPIPLKRMTIIRFYSAPNGAGRFYVAQCYNNMLVRSKIGLVLLTVSSSSNGNQWVQNTLLL